MFRKEKIEFFASKLHLEAFPHPKPAVKFLPPYYQKLKPQIDPHPKNVTVKRCIPFLDSLTHGYIIPLWSDVYIRASNGAISVEFPEDLPMNSSLSPHKSVQIENHPLSDKPYANLPMKWHNPWGVKTPKGWSCLFTSPLNHLESRFKILDGIVDTDTYYNQVNLPFIWTGGEGDFFIPQGTPLVQVIPYKRIETTCDIVVIDRDKHDAVLGKLGAKMRNKYRSLFWHKKQE